MTRKDVIFFTIIILWVISAVTLAFSKYSAYSLIPQLISMTILVILILLKNNNTVFNIWIEEKLSDIKKDNNLSIQRDKTITNILKPKSKWYELHKRIRKGV